MKRLVCLMICSLGIASSAWAGNQDFSQTCPYLATQNLCTSVIYCAWINEGSCLAKDPKFAQTCPILATEGLCQDVIYCSWSNAGHCVAR